MNIIINEGNRAKIESALKSAQGKATERTMDFADVCDAVSAIDSHLGKLGLSEALKDGAKVFCQPGAGKFPRAYKYVPMATFVEVVRRNRKWRLVEVGRCDCNRSKRFHIRFGNRDAVADALVTRAGKF